MTFGKASALGLGFLCAVALGVWIGPYVTGDRTTAKERPAAHATEPSAAAAKSQPAATAPRTEVSRARTPVIALSAPELHEQLKPLLNKGTDITLAAEGFRNAEQFATLVHAARNTEVPFVVLKHRVLTEGKALAAAIRESKPDMDAMMEANRARAQARSDIARLRG